MRLEKNIVAPTFKVDDIFDRTIDLENYKDKKVFIGFFRHAGCPFCNIRVYSLLKVSKELKDKGLEMIFFFESQKETLLRSIFHKTISPIPLISDPEKKWYDAYGLENSRVKSSISHLSSFVQTAYKAYSLGLPIHLMSGKESISTIPAEFLLDKNLIIKEVHYSERLNDRMNINRVMQFALE